MLEAGTYQTVGDVVGLVNIGTELEHDRRMFARLEQTFHHFAGALDAQDLQLWQLFRLLSSLFRPINSRGFRLARLLADMSQKHRHSQHSTIFQPWRDLLLKYPITQTISMKMTYARLNSQANCVVHYLLTAGQHTYSVVANGITGLYKFHIIIIISECVYHPNIHLSILQCNRFGNK